MGNEAEQTPTGQGIGSSGLGYTINRPPGRPRKLPKELFPKLSKSSKPKGTCKDPNHFSKGGRGPDDSDGSSPGITV